MPAPDGPFQEGRTLRRRARIAGVAWRTDTRRQTTEHALPAARSGPRDLIGRRTLAPLNDPRRPMTKNDARSAPDVLPTRTKPTGQKRSLERGKATRKKNPGKRAKHGG